MTVKAVYATRITCDHLISTDETCPSRILGDNPTIGEAEFRLGAAECGWGTGSEGDLCPKHKLSSLIAGTQLSPVELDTGSRIQITATSI